MAKASNKKPKKPVKMAESPEQLYATALELVEQSQPAEALSKALQLLTLVKNKSASQILPALNLLGDISIELGETDEARSYFERAVQLDPDGSIPEAAGGGAEKFLWLAQLCENGGKESVTWFEKGVKALQNEINTLENGKQVSIDIEALMMLRVEKKRKLANALCGIVEVYMTDLSWEDDAEARCENLVTEAMAVEDEPSPEVLQTLASVRLSQDRKDDAQAALQRSVKSWKDLQPEDPGVPDFPTRISLSRLLMEADMLEEAMEVLNRLVQEDDQSVEAWYLGGWCQHLAAEQLQNHSAKTNGNAATADPHQTLEATMKGSRHWLNTSIKLYELLDYEDERLLSHAEELVAALNTVLGPEAENAEEEDGDYDDEWDGLGDDEEENADEEMKDA